MKDSDDEVRANLHFLIDSVVSTIRRAEDHFADSVYRRKDQRRFAGEVERIVAECVKKLAFMFLREAGQPVLKALYQSDEARLAYFQAVDDAVENVLIPRLRQIERPGDVFSCWMELKQTTKEFGQLYDEIAKQRGEFGFVDATALIAVVALTVQAQNAMAAGHEREAWLNLVDAAYWLGNIDGGRIGFYTGNRYGASSSLSVRAKDNAVKKNSGHRRIKALAIKLLYHARPPSGWPTIGAAAGALRDELQAEWERINQQLEATGRKRIAMVTDRTVQSWFRSLDEREKAYLFASKMSAE